MNNTSTWSQDVQRGLDHPDSVAARQERAKARSDAEAGRRATLTHALYLLERSVRTEADVVRALHCLSAGLVRQQPLAGSDESETVQALDELADEIQYSGAEA